MATQQRLDRVADQITAATATTADAASGYADSCPAGGSPDTGSGVGGADVHCGPHLPGEREIALLAATGLTSQAIAASLTLSIRTIDNNLASVYRKLGIKGRRALDRALAPR